MTTAENLGDVSTVDTLLWVVLPYVCLAVFVVGHWWRYRYDKFGWTTRSSQLYENRLLRMGSPLFHFGMLFVVARARHRARRAADVDRGRRGLRGHVPRRRRSAVGTVAGVCTVVGMAILIYRRRTVGPVFSATTRMDKVMYAVLATVIVLGLVEHRGRPTSSATTTTARASRSGSAASSGSTRSPS